MNALDSISDHLRLHSREALEGRRTALPSPRQLWAKGPPSSWAGRGICWDLSARRLALGALPRHHDPTNSGGMRQNLLTIAAAPTAGAAHDATLSPYGRLSLSEKAS